MKASDPAGRGIQERTGKRDWGGPKPNKIELEGKKLSYSLSVGIRAPLVQFSYV